MERKLTGKIREQDQIWIINARGVVHCPGEKCQRILCDVDVAQKVDNCWQELCMEDLVAEINQDKTRQNVVFIHGNRTDFGWAKLRGTEIYESTVFHSENSGCCEFDCDLANIETQTAPVRWIIWAWPSDKICGPKRDLDQKQQRAVDQGRLLATFFNRIVSEKISVIAYSLGARAFACSLEHINHPDLQRVDFVKNTKPKSNSDSETIVKKPKPKVHLASVKKESSKPKQEKTVKKKGRFHVVMIAAAIPTDWVQSNVALAENVDHLTLVNNPKDRVLRGYQKLTDQKALGSLECVDCSVVPCDVVRVNNRKLVNHFLDQYLESECARDAIRHGIQQESKTIIIEEKAAPIDKPGSVESDHLSGTTITRRLTQPTR